MIQVQRSKPRPGGWLVAPALLLLGAFAVPAVLLLAGQGEPAFNRVDTAWQAFSFTLHSPFWDGVNAVLNVAGYTGALILHGLLALLLWARGRPRAALFATSSGVVVLALTQLTKAVVGRERPQGAKVLTDTGSYPSGHVSATTAFLLVLAVLISRWWMTAVAALGVVAMMISRTYLSAHWLSDVLGGACLAAGLVLLLWWRFRNICLEEYRSEAGEATWFSGASRRQPAAKQAE